MPSATTSPAANVVASRREDARRAVTACERILAIAKGTVATKIKTGGGIDAEQHAAHGLSWLATYVEALRQMQAWAERLSEAGTFGEIEQLIHGIAFAEYAAQIAGGIAISQSEVVRLADLGLGAADIGRFTNETATLAQYADRAARARLAGLIAANPNAVSYGDPGLDDTHIAIRDQMRRFSMDEVLPHAHGWHLANRYIPLELIAKLSELGVFGLTIPEEFGGMGLGKEAMCVVSEELSRGYIGVGSLGTRSEIAAELILLGGTDAQKAHYLPKIAAGSQAFQGNLFDNPARFNVLESAGKTLVVTDGRNASALVALIEALDNFPHEKRTVVYSAEEDRRDQDIIKQGQLLGRGFDRVILCEIESGAERPVGEVTRLLRAGVEGAARTRQIEEIRDWTTAVDAAWSCLGRGEMLVIQTCTVPKTVRKLQSLLGLEPAEAAA